MAFTVIKGTFHVVGYSPDGDSIRFQADDSRVFGRLSGPPPRINARGHVQLRLEAIDTLETHFTPDHSDSVLHQPLALANAASDALMHFTGISEVVWSSDHKSVVTARDGTRGYILSRSVEKNRRPVAFLFAGDPPEADGTAAHLDAVRLRASYNHLALASGLAYPTYYTGLFFDLRAVMTAATTDARQSGLGVHAGDATLSGVDVSGLAAITDDHPILPKLFRRITEYYVNFGSVVGFKEMMEKSAEPVLDLQTQNFTHFDTFIQQTGNTIRLTRRPEELVFDEMPTRPPAAFATLMERSEFA